MSSPELVYCALVALAGYALFLISSHMKAKNDPPTRRRRAQPAVPVATAGSGTAHAAVVHPRRKVIQRNLSVVYENESDIEEVAPPSSTQQGSSSGAGAGSQARLDSRSSNRSAQGHSRARSRSRSVVDVPAQLSTLEQLVTAVRARATASVVPLALTIGINPPAPRTPSAEPFAAPVSPLPVCMPPTAPLAPVRLSTPPSSLRLPSPPGIARAPSIGPSNINQAPSAGPSAHLAAEQDPPSAPGTGFTQLTVGGSPIVRTERKVTPRPKHNEPRKTILTPYWGPGKTPALELIRAPPDLTSDPELAVGDVFHWYTAVQYRLWVWDSDDDGLSKWQATNVPSWVSQEHYADLDHAMRSKDAYEPESEL
ncbi:hypothetical protein K466DRAFT_605075 [Polyporus arcularius HHB13444]|uniref:Uncharacterized protein n=1 Tax=Polyporus arcularius HHB13444 TaxID=1314778 RepID=A0A5C3NWQ8_9APHY|nr:hypothetical protein K466DRAFT_605075 [Polyporus arcularius HHB13444]